MTGDPHLRNQHRKMLDEYRTLWTWCLSDVEQVFFFRVVIDERSNEEEKKLQLISTHSHFRSPTEDAIYGLFHLAEWRTPQP
jgi:hypothetical protein